MKIGLIGAENSHTRLFCKAFNVEGVSEGNRITHVFGDDSSEAAEALSADFGLTICATEAELLSVCDAVVITYRCGTRHFEPAMRAIRAGKAVFNDKPFTATVEQAEALEAYAEANGSLITGGSSLKSLPELDGIRAKLAPGSTVVISYGAEVDSPYDGFLFYGIHSVEICLSLFGADYTSVAAVNHHGAVVVTVAYADRQCVIMTRPNVYDFRIMHVGQGVAEYIDIPDMHVDISANELAAMLETKTVVHPFAHYVDAARLISEIMEKAGL